MRRNRAEEIIFAIFALVGIAMFAGAIVWLAQMFHFREKAIKVTAAIEKIETYRDSDGDLRHRVYVTYEANGRRYRNVPINEYSSDMHKGMNVEIWCDPVRPEWAEFQNGMWIGPVVLIVMGLVFGLVGIIPLGLKVRQAAKRKRLLASGKILYGKVDRVEQNYNYTVNERSPYRVYCSWQDEYGGTEYNFGSENIWNALDELLFPGDMISIYVNETDYSDYYVDVESAVGGQIVDYT